MTSGKFPYPLPHRFQTQNTQTVVGSSGSAPLRTTVSSARLTKITSVIGSISTDSSQNLPNTSTKNLYCL